MYALDMESLIMLRIQVCSIHGIFDHATCQCMLHTWNLRSCYVFKYDTYMESSI
ncbi:hypothetical protein LINGRAHAP2_LOCUS29354, partial [Linum grandiflorum]